MANITIEKIYEQVRGSVGDKLRDYKEKPIKVIFDSGKLNAIVRVCKVQNNEGACKRILLAFEGRDLIPGRPIVIDEVQEATIFGS